MTDFALISREEIADEDWNNTILRDPNFRIYPLTHFLDATCDWVALIERNYRWIWPLPIKKLPFKRVYQPLLCQQLGPYGEISKEELREVWSFLKSEFAELHSKWNERFLDNEFQVGQSQRNIELSLEPSFDELFKKFNRNVISNLKKATKANLQIDASREFDPWALKTFKESRGKKIKELDHKFYHHAEMIYRAFQARGEAFVYTASMNEQKVAQVYLLTVHNRLLHFFSASHDLGRNNGGMHAILRMIIEKYSNKKLILDFEGSNDENLAFFYKSFGGEEHFYPEVRYSRFEAVKQIFK